MSVQGFPFESAICWSCCAMKEQRIETLDGGKPFDWGRVSSDYAKYRDIYSA